MAGTRHETAHAGRAAQATVQAAESRVADALAAIDRHVVEQTWANHTGAGGTFVHESVQLAELHRELHAAAKQLRSFGGEHRDAVTALYEAAEARTLHQAFDFVRQAERLPSELARSGSKTVQIDHSAFDAIDKNVFVVRHTLPSLRTRLTQAIRQGDVERTTGLSQQIAEAERVIRAAPGAVSMLRSMNSPGGPSTHGASASGGVAHAVEGLLGDAALSLLEGLL